MGKECSFCSFNEKKRLDEITALHFERQQKLSNENYNEKQ